MDSELRHNIRNRWLNSLFEFAHLDFQKRLWNAEYRGAVGDFTEAICQYFDDLSLDNGYQYFIEKGFISSDEFEVVKDFHNQLDKYSEKSNKLDLSDNQVLQDPEWIELTIVAKKNWDKLKTIIKDPEELRNMIHLEESYLKPHSK